MVYAAVRDVVIVGYGVAAHDVAVPVAQQDVVLGARAEELVRSVHAGVNDCNHDGIVRISVKTRGAQHLFHRSFHGCKIEIFFSAEPRLTRDFVEETLRERGG